MGPFNVLFISPQLLNGAFVLSTMANLSNDTVGRTPTDVTANDVNYVPLVQQQLLNASANHSQHM